MTVSKIDPVNNYTGNGSTTTFDFDFLIENESELLVQHTDAMGIQNTLTLNIDYTINRTGSETGSYITFPIEGSSYSILGEGEVISLTTNLPIEQIKEYKNSGKLNLITLEWSLDYITRLIQQMARQVARSIKVQEGSTQTADDLIEALQEAQEKAASNANAALNSANAAAASANNSKDYYERCEQAYDRSEQLNNEAAAMINNGKQTLIDTANACIKDVQAIGIYMIGDRLFYKDSNGVEHEFRNDFGGIAPMAVKQRDLKECEYEEEKIVGSIEFNSEDATTEEIAEFTGKTVEEIEALSEEDLLTLIDETVAEKTAELPREYITHKGYLLTWTDPDDSSYMDNIYCTWGNTLILRKEGAYPESPYDGEVVVNSTVRNTYASEGYFDEVDTTKDWKYRAFPCSINKVYNLDEKNKFGFWLFAYSELDTEKDPAKRITYLEDNEYFNENYMDFTNDVFNYGDWKNSPFYSYDYIRPCMLYNEWAENNVVRVGALNTEENVLSGFTTAIYAYINSKVEDYIETLNFRTKFTTGSNVSTEQYIAGQLATDTKCPQIGIASGVMTIKVGNGTSWDNPISGISVAANTNYELELVFERRKITALLSTNGSEFVEVGSATVDFGTIAWNDNMTIGCDLKKSPFLGSIDLKGWYVDINGERWWTGLTDKKAGTVMEYLDPDNHALTIDGAASHVSDLNCNANAMVEKKAIFTKRVAEGKRTTVYFSNVKLDEGFECYPCKRPDGTYEEYYYTPMFDGSLQNNLLVSLAGNLTVISSKTAAEEITFARRNGAGCDTEVEADEQLEEDIFKLVFKNTDSQSKLGAGKSNGGSDVGACMKTGTMTTKGQNWGSTSTSVGCKWRYRENPYASQWKRKRGLIIVNGVTKIKMTKGTQDGSTTDDYNLTGDGYITLSDVPAASGTSGGYISETVNNKYGMYSTVVSGSSTTGLCDGRWFNNGIVAYPYRGGYSSNGTLCGMFSLISDYAASGASWHIGAALSYKPSSRG